MRPAEHQEKQCHSTSVPRNCRAVGQFNTNRQHLLHRLPKGHVVFLQQKKKKGKLSQEDEANIQDMGGAEVSQAEWPNCPRQQFQVWIPWVWIPIVFHPLVWAWAHLHSTHSDITYLQVPCSPHTFFFQSVNILLTLDCKCLSLLGALIIPN